MATIVNSIACLIGYFCLFCFGAYWLNQAWESAEQKWSRWKYIRRCRREFADSAVERLNRLEYESQESKKKAQWLHERILMLEKK